MLIEESAQMALANPQSIGQFVDRSSMVEGPHFD
jgi:hypothetical protein